MEEILIRKYEAEDRNFIRDIASKTAFMGEPSDIFFKNRETLADFLTLYFTDYEPESCFVAEFKGKVIGYLIGAKNIKILKKIFLIKILPGLLWRFLLKGGFLKIKNLIFLFYSLKSLLKGEFKMPDLSSNYPATLHINLDKDFRNSRIGSKLISNYLEYLKERKIKGISFTTVSNEAGFFFSKQGFDLLYSGRRSYFKYILKKDIPIYIYGKKL